MKKVLFVLQIALLLILTSCINPTIKPIGVIPSKEFEVNPILDNNAIFEEKSIVNISGTAEANVGIKAELINKNKKVISSQEVLTDEISKTWTVKFMAPKGSFEKYQIKISDSYNKFSKTFDRIRFGHLYMIAGDGYLASKTNEIGTRLEEINDDLFKSENIAIYSQSLNDAKWLTTEEEYLALNPFVATFCREMLLANNMPTGVITVCEENTYLHEWLFKNTIDNYTIISNGLKDKGLYVENPTKNGEMSFIGENLLKPLVGVRINTIIWSQGQSELDKFEDKNYIDNYFQMLYVLFSSWRNCFGPFELKVLQAENSINRYVVSLRNVQKITTDYYSFATIIPTFDLSNSSESTHNIDYDKLAKRVKDVIKNNREISKYDNLILEIDPLYDAVTTIHIEFSNTDRLLLELNEDEKLINYIKIYYNDEEKGKVLLDINPTLADNFIVIDLIYKEETLDEEGNSVIVTKVYDKSLISIEYGMESDLSKANLFNDSGIPLLPFSIDID